MDVHGDDAALLIFEVGIPAHVFGNSAGAHVGLDLVARHPALVRELVAHEPPCLTLLDDPSEMMAGGKAIHGMGLALALRLDTDPVAFPGDHLGFGSRPDAFADTLLRVLDGG